MVVDVDVRCVDDIHIRIVFDRGFFRKQLVLVVVKNCDKNGNKVLF